MGLSDFLRKKREEKEFGALVEQEPEAAPAAPAPAPAPASVPVPDLTAEDFDAATRAVTAGERVGFDRVLQRPEYSAPAVRNLVDVYQAVYRQTMRETLPSSDPTEPRMSQNDRERLAAARGQTAMTAVLGPGAKQQAIEEERSARKWFDDPDVGVPYSGVDERIIGTAVDALAALGDVTGVLPKETTDLVRQAMKPRLVIAGSPPNAPSLTLDEARKAALEGETIIEAGPAADTLRDLGGVFRVPQEAVYQTLSGLGVEEVDLDFGAPAAPGPQLPAFDSKGVRRVEGVSYGGPSLTGVFRGLSDWATGAADTRTLAEGGRAGLPGEPRLAPKFYVGKPSERGLDPKIDVMGNPVQRVVHAAADAINRDMWFADDSTRVAEFRGVEPGTPEWDAAWWGGAGFDVSGVAELAALRGVGAARVGTRATIAARQAPQGMRAATFAAVMRGDPVWADEAMARAVYNAFAKGGAPEVERFLGSSDFGDLKAFIREADPDIASVDEWLAATHKGEAESFEPPLSAPRPPDPPSESELDQVFDMFPPGPSPSSVDEWLDATKPPAPKPEAPAPKPKPKAESPEVERLRKEAEELGAEPAPKPPTPTTKPAGSWRDVGSGAPEARHIEEFAREMSEGAIAQDDLAAQQFFANNSAEIEAALQRAAAKPASKPAAAAAKATGAPTLPEGLAGAKPRYKRQVLEFDSDLDKALYIIGSKKKSKSYQKYYDFALQHLDESEIADASKRVRDRIRAQAEAQADADVVRIPSDRPAAAAAKPAAAPVRPDPSGEPAATAKPAAAPRSWWRENLELGVDGRHAESFIEDWAKGKILPDDVEAQKFRTEHKELIEEELRHWSTLPSAYPNDLPVEAEHLDLYWELRRAGKSNEEAYYAIEALAGEAAVEAAKPAAAAAAKAAETPEMARLRKEAEELGAEPTPELDMDMRQVGEGEPVPAFKEPPVEPPAKPQPPATPLPNAKPKAPAARPAQVSSAKKKGPAAEGPEWEAARAEHGTDDLRYSSYDEKWLPKDTIDLHVGELINEAGDIVRVQRTKPWKMTDDPLGDIALKENTFQSHEQVQEYMDFVADELKKQGRTKKEVYESAQQWGVRTKGFAARALQHLDPVGDDTYRMVFWPRSGLEDKTVTLPQALKEFAAMFAAGKGDDLAIIKRGERAIARWDRQKGSKASRFIADRQTALPEELELFAPYKVKTGKRGAPRLEWEISDDAVARARALNIKAMLYGSSGKSPSAWQRRFAHAVKWMEDEGGGTDLMFLNRLYDGAQDQMSRRFLGGPELPKHLTNREQMILDAAREVSRRRVRATLGDERLVPVAGRLLLAPAEAKRVLRSAERAFSESKIDVSKWKSVTEKGKDGKATEYWVVPEGQRKSYSDMLQYENMFLGAQSDFLETGKLLPEQHQLLHEQFMSNLAGRSAHARWAIRGTMPFHRKVAEAVTILTGTHPEDMASHLKVGKSGIAGGLLRVQDVVGGTRQSRLAWESIKTRLAATPEAIVRDIRRLRKMGITDPDEIVETLFGSHYAPLARVEADLYAEVVKLASKKAKKGEKVEPITAEQVAKLQAGIRQSLSGRTLRAMGAGDVLHPDAAVAFEAMQELAERRVRQSRRHAKWYLESFIKQKKLDQGSFQIDLKSLKSQDWDRLYDRVVRQNGGVDALLADSAVSKFVRANDLLDEGNAKLRFITRVRGERTLHEEVQKLLASEFALREGKTADAVLAMLRDDVSMLDLSSGKAVLRGEHTPKAIADAWRFLQRNGLADETSLSKIYRKEGAWGPFLRALDSYIPPAFKGKKLPKADDTAVAPELGVLSMEEIEEIAGAKIYVTNQFANEVKAALERTGIRGSELAADTSAGKFLAESLRQYKAAITLPAPGYHLGNMLGQPFLMGLTIGASRTAGAYSAMFRHSPLVGELIKRTTESDVVERVGDVVLAPFRAKPEKGVRVFQTRDGRIFSVEQLEQMISEGGLSLSRSSVETASSIAQEIRASNANWILRGWNKSYDFLREFSGNVDTAARIGAMLDELERGGSIASAQRMGRKSVLDYNRLTEFERRYLRWGATFYAFRRSALDAGIDAWVRNPHRMARIVKFYRSQGDVWGLPDETQMNMDQRALSRLILDYRKGVSEPDGMMNPRWAGVMLNSTPLPDAEALFMTRDLFNIFSNAAVDPSGKNWNESFRDLVWSDVTPHVALAIVAGGQYGWYDPQRGREIRPLDMWNDRVPSWMVENETLGPTMKEMYNIKWIPFRPGKDQPEDMSYSSFRHGEAGWYAAVDDEYKTGASKWRSERMLMGRMYDTVGRLGDTAMAVVGNERMSDPSYSMGPFTVPRLLGATPRLVPSVAETAAREARAQTSQGARTITRARRVAGEQ